MIDLSQSSPDLAAPTSAAPQSSADTVAALQARLAEAQAQVTALQAQAAHDAAAKRDLETAVANLTSVQVQQTEDEKLIADKMSKGLTRQQAAAVIRRQRVWDQSDYGKSLKARHEAAQLR